MNFDAESRITLTGDFFSFPEDEDYNFGSQQDLVSRSAWEAYAYAGMQPPLEEGYQPVEHQIMGWTTAEVDEVRSLLEDVGSLEDLGVTSIPLDNYAHTAASLAAAADIAESEDVLDDEESSGSTDSDGGADSNGEPFFELTDDEEEEVVETGSVCDNRSDFRRIIDEWMAEMSAVADKMVETIPSLGEIDREYLIEALSGTLGMVNNETLVFTNQHAWFTSGLLAILVRSNPTLDDLRSTSNPVQTESPQQSKSKWRVTFEKTSGPDRKFLVRPVRDVVAAILTLLIENKQTECEAYSSHPMVVLILARMVRDLLGTDEPMYQLCGIPKTSVAYRPEMYCYMALNRLPVTNPWGDTPAMPYKMNSQEVFLALANACSGCSIWEMTDFLTKVCQCYEASEDTHCSITGRIRQRLIPAVPRIPPAVEHQKVADAVRRAVADIGNGSDQDVEGRPELMSVLDAAAIGCVMRANGMMTIRTCPYRYAWVGCYESSEPTDGRSALCLAASGPVLASMADHLGLDENGDICAGHKLLLFPTAVPTMLMECLETALPIVQNALQDPSFQFRMYHASGMSVVSVPESVVGLLRAALYTSTHRSDPVNKSVTNHGTDGFIISAIMQDAFKDAQCSENTVRARAARRTFLCGLFAWLNVIGNKKHRRIMVDRTVDDYDALFFSVRNILIFLPAGVLPGCAGNLDGSRLMMNTLKVLTNMVKFSRTPTSEFYATSRTWIERIVGSFFAIVELYSTADPTEMGSFMMETEVFLNIASIILESNDPYVLSLDNGSSWVKAAISGHPVYNRTEAVSDMFEIDQMLILRILDVANNMQLIPAVAATRARVYTSVRFMRSGRRGSERNTAQMTFDMFSPNKDAHGALFWPCFTQAISTGGLQFYQSYTDDMIMKLDRAAAPRSESCLLKRLCKQSVLQDGQTYCGTEAVLSKTPAISLKRDDFVYHVFSLFECMTCSMCAAGTPCQGSRVQYIGTGAQLNALPVSVYHNTERVVYDTYGNSIALIRGFMVQAFSAFSPGTSNLGAAVLANCTLFRDATLYPSETSRKRARNEQ